MCPSVCCSTGLCALSPWSVLCHLHTGITIFVITVLQGCLLPCLSLVLYEAPYTIFPLPSGFYSAVFTGYQCLSCWSHYLWEIKHVTVLPHCTREKSQTSVWCHYIASTSITEVYCNYDSLSLTRALHPSFPLLMDFSCRLPSQPSLNAPSCLCS